jgi:hypothetical protein
MMKMNLDGKTWKRKDLKKYSKMTRVISFHCDSAWTGTGTEARDFLKQFFKDIYMHLSETAKEVIKESKSEEIKKLGQILGDKSWVM